MLVAVAVADESVVLVEVEVWSTRTGDAEVAGSVSLGGAEVAESEKRCGSVGL